MQTALFRHSDIADPYGFYTTMLTRSPLFRDKDSGAWIIYDYAHCKQLLHDEKAQIPEQAPKDLELMNVYSLRLIRNLVRLRNPSDHVLARLVTLKLFETKVSVSITGILEQLLPSRKQPANQFITVDQNRIPVICVSNLVGLFIQSYDAGRGILGNSLLQLSLQGDLSKLQAGNRDYIAAAVLETLRYDPPVHNPRRILTEDIFIDHTKLEKGQLVVLMLAAANRDARRFTHTGIFDPYRATITKG